MSHLFRRLWGMGEVEFSDRGSEQVTGLVSYPEVASGEVPFECSVPVAEMACRLQFLELLPPGSLLGRALGSVDRGELNGHDLVHLLRGRRRQIAWLEAESLADMVELGHCPPSVPGSPPVRTQVMEDHVADELKMALVWTRRAAESTLDVAWQLVERLPRVWEALREGRIDLPRARVIASGVAHLDEVVAGEVADRVLGEAEELTTGQIRARLGRLCVEVDPDDARRRYEEGLERRRLTSELGEGGTADLLGENLPADRAAAIVSHIHEEALRRRRGVSYPRGGAAAPPWRRYPQHGPATGRHLLGTSRRQRSPRIWPPSGGRHPGRSGDSGGFGRAGG